jgi:ABC-type polysaccharide/polyol phosphate export permease
MFAGTKLAILFNINPMAIIINGYRDIFFYQSMPHIKTIFVLIIACTIFCAISLKVFQKLSKGFAEEV